MSRIPILTIGSDKDLFISYSRSARRQVAYAGSEFEQHIVVFSHARLKNHVTHIGDSVHVYPTNARIPLFHLLRAFFISYSLILKSKRRDWVVSTQDPFEAGLLGLILARVCRLPLQVQEHGDFFSTPDWRKESLLNRIRYNIGLFVLARATQVRVVSKRIEKKLISLGVKKEKIVCFPVVTPVEEYVHAVPKLGLQEKTGMSGPFVLWVGRMVPQKNVALLIDAFARVLVSIPEACLVLVGSGSEKKNITSQIERLRIREKVFMYDWTDDVASMYKTAHVYALSSNYEGWGRVVIEALASRLPVVMTDVGCAGEVVQSGVSGVVVPLHDMNSFAEGVVQVLQDEEKRNMYIQNGREALMKLGTIEQTIMRMQESWRSARAESL